MKLLKIKIKYQKIKYKKKKYIDKINLLNNSSYYKKLIH